MSLKDLKQRINTVKSTQKITKAMQMVAASKLNKSRIAAEQGKTYADLMHNIVFDVVESLNSESNDRSLLFGAKIVQKILVIVVSSDRGLCGAYNSNVMRFAEQVITNHESNGKEIKLITIGKKAYEYCSKKHSSKMMRNYNGITGKPIEFAKSCELAEEMMQNFDDKEFDRCEIIFSNFKSVISQNPTSRSLIPVNDGANFKEMYDEKEATENKQQSRIRPPSLTDSGEFTFDPSRGEILESLIPENIKVQLHRALLEGDASEHAARMTAMDSATRNCGDMIDSLRIVYNRTRQAQITKELIEIISGAEAI